MANDSSRPPLSETNELLRIRLNTTIGVVFDTLFAEFREKRGVVFLVDGSYSPERRLPST